MRPLQTTDLLSVSAEPGYELILDPKIMIVNALVLRARAEQLRVPAESTDTSLVPRILSDHLLLHNVPYLDETSICADCEVGASTGPVDRCDLIFLTQIVELCHL